MTAGALLLQICDENITIKLLWYADAKYLK